jgi:hypothetical protein
VLEMDKTQKQIKKKKIDKTRTLAVTTRMIKPPRRRSLPQHS